MYDVIWHLPRGIETVLEYCRISMFQLLYPVAEYRMIRCVSELSYRGDIYSTGTFVISF